MRSKKLVRFIGIGVALILTVSLLLAGCAQAPSGVQIRTMGGYTGSTAQLYAHAFAKIINDANHPFLTATSIETHGGAENIKINAAAPASAAIGLFHTGQMSRPAAIKGEPPYDKVYPAPLAMVFTGTFPMAVITLDPNIKKPEDLYGKKIGMSPKGGSVNQWSHWMLKDCWGLDLSKIDEQNISWGDAKSALLDGVIDGYICALTFVAGKFQVHPSMDTPFLTREAYFVGHTAEDVAKGCKAAGITVSYMKVPVGALGPKQTEPIGTSVFHNTYYAYKEMKTDVAYEVTKILYGNVDKVGTFFAAGKALTTKTYTWFPVPAEEDIHPGAMKYFKENNIPVFVGGKSPF